LAGGAGSGSGDGSQHAAGGLEAVVRFASGDPFEPTRWWRNTTDVTSVSREWLALLNVWAGFPVQSTRE